MEGYYVTYREEYRFNQDGDEYRKARATGRWEPWNPKLEIVLKKIGNPIPLYAKRVKMKLPAIGEMIGFDLEKADWVAPHGEGTSVDLQIALSRRFEEGAVDPYYVRLEVFFPGEWNGIQEYYAHRKKGSLLRLLRHAPNDGYENRLVIEYPGPNVKIKHTNYFYRVRSETDGTGKERRAIYGKTLGNFYFGFTDRAVSKGLIEFAYYLNPEYNNRNLEFDPLKNLFTDLDPGEGLIMP